MHTKSSINIKPAKINSELHNERISKNLDYVFYDRTHLNTSLVIHRIAKYRNYLEGLAKEKTGRTMQKSATPIREGVLNLSDNSTMSDLIKLASRLEESFGIKTLQIHIHEDEGRFEDGNFLQNRHAHMVFSWMDESTGKSLKLKPQDMAAIQDVVADALKMERGESSNKIHLNAIQYKRQQEELKLKEAQEKLLIAQNESKIAIEELNKTKAAHKIANTNERLKETGLSILSTISGKKDTVIKQLENESNQSKQMIQKLITTNNDLGIKLEKLTVDWDDLEKKHAEMKNTNQQILMENTLIQVQLNVTKGELDRLKQHYKKLLEFKDRIKNLLINSFIKNDPEAQKKVLEITAVFNKQKIENDKILIEDIKRRKGLSI